MTQTSSRNFLTGFALALLGAVLFSGKAIVVKLSYRYQVDAMTVLALRMTFSLPFFVAAAYWSRRRAAVNRVTVALEPVSAADAVPAPIAHPGTAPLTRGDWWQVIWLGIAGYYLASFLDFLGLQYISAGLERLILFLYPTVVLAIGAYWFKRPISRSQWAATAVCYAGIALVFAHDFSIGGANVPLGAAFVFASAISYALYLVGAGQLVKRIGSLRLSAYCSIVACVLCIAQFTLFHDWSVLHGLANEVWALSVFNAVFCTVLPVFATMSAIDRIGASTVSLTGMVGPVATIFFAAWLLGEATTGWQVAGTALVLIGVFLTGRAGR